MALVFFEPASGKPPPSARWTVPPIFSSNKMFRVNRSIRSFVAIGVDLAVGHVEVTAGVDETAAFYRQSQVHVRAFQFNPPLPGEPRRKPPLAFVKLPPLPNPLFFLLLS